MKNTEANLRTKTTLDCMEERHNSLGDITPCVLAVLRYSNAGLAAKLCAARVDGAFFKSK